MNILGITLKFDAAHFLPGYNGECSRMHGHTWRVDFGFRYDPNKLNSCGIAGWGKVRQARLGQARSGAACHGQARRDTARQAWF